MTGIFIIKRKREEEKMQKGISAIAILALLITTTIVIENVLHTTQEVQQKPYEETGIRECKAACEQEPGCTYQCLALLGEGKLKLVKK